MKIFLFLSFFESLISKGKMCSSENIYNENKYPVSSLLSEVWRCYCCTEKLNIRTFKKSARIIHLQANAQYGWTLGGCSLRFLEVHETFSWPNKFTSLTMSKQEKNNYKYFL